MPLCSSLPARHRAACRRRTLQALLADEEVWASAQLLAELRGRPGPLAWRSRLVVWVSRWPSPCA
jgi:hypothetical protein